MKEEILVTIDARTGKVHACDMPKKDFDKFLSQKIYHSEISYIVTSKKMFLSCLDRMAEKYLNKGGIR